MAKSQSTLDPIAAALEPAVRRIAREEIAAALASMGRSSVANGDNPTAMTLDEAARSSRLGMSTLKAAVREGRLKTVSHGRRRLVLPDDLKAFVAAGR
jgi:excisionase family DNA binding protein